jgi:hypothetical protein
MWYETLLNGLFSGGSQQKEEKDYTQTITFSVISILLIVVILVISTVILRKK